MLNSPRQLNIQFPLGGLHRGVGFQQQPPYTTPDCLNVRPYDFEGRERGGGRPGLIKAFYSQLGNGNPVRLLETVGTSSTGQKRWTDQFENELGVWSKANWIEGELARKPLYLNGGLTSPEEFIVPFTAPYYPLDFDFYYNSSVDYSGMYLLGYARAHTESFSCTSRLSPLWLIDMPPKYILRVIIDWRETSAPFDRLPGYDMWGMAIMMSTEGSYILREHLLWQPRFGEYLNVFPPPSEDKPIYDESKYIVECGQVRTSVSPWSTDEPYILRAYIKPYNGTHAGDYHIYLRMNDSNPDVRNNGIDVRLRLFGTDGGGGGEITKYIDGTPTEYSYTVDPSTIDNYPAEGWFVVKFYPSNNVVDVYWRGVKLVSQQCILGSGAGHRFGIGLKTTEILTRCFIESFDLLYNDGSSGFTRRNLLIASSDGKIYLENESAELELVSSSLTIASDRSVQGQEHLQKLYIADFSNAKASSVVHSGTVDGTSFDDLQIDDWTELDISTDDDVVVIYDGTGTVIDGVYEISAVTAGTITLSRSAGSGTCNYRIERGPKIFDPQTNTLSLWMATAGSVPVGCPLIALYRDRIVLAGQETSPHLWYMSRQGNPLDWDYGASFDDYSRAIAGQNAEAGVLGDMITALIPFTDDYLLFGCSHSLWVLRGDPAMGGQIDSVSRNVGIVSANAWCRTPEGAVVFLSFDGLYLLEPGLQGVPTPISHDVLPKELKQIDPTTTVVMMEFDVDANGIHIFLSPIEEGTITHWWLDWRRKRFWPVQIPVSTEPMSILLYNTERTGERAVLLGGRDGYIRRFSKDADTDDGEPITNYVLVGPIRLANNDAEAGMLTELTPTLGGESAIVRWDLLPAESAEAAVKTTNSWLSGTWAVKPGLRNYTERFRLRAGALCIKLSGPTSPNWVVESIIGIVGNAGRQRLL